MLYKVGDVIDNVGKVLEVIISSRGEIGYKVQEKNKEGCTFYEQRDLFTKADLIKTLEKIFKGTEL